MAKINPPHPGEYLHFNYMVPFSLSCRFLAENLEVAGSTLNSLLTAQSTINPDMAQRLSEVIGRSPETWLAMQRTYDKWLIGTRVRLVGAPETSLNSA